MPLRIQTADLPANPADKNSADTVKRPDFQTEADTKADQSSTGYPLCFDTLHWRYCAVQPLITTLSGCGPQNATTEKAAEVKAVAPDSLSLWPELKSPLINNDTEQRVQQLLSAMTIEQKVAQLIQPGYPLDDSRRYAPVWFWFLSQWWRCLSK